MRFTSAVVAAMLPLRLAALNGRAARLGRRATTMSAVSGYVPPSPEELTPRSEAMVARATRCKEAFPHRFVAPKEAAEMIRVGATICDVRTEEQALGHEIGGVPGRTPPDARRLALDNMVIAGGPPPMLGGGGRKVILACTAGPKSAIAVEFLLEFGIDAYAVDGGLLGWHAAGLPVAGLLDDDDDDDDDFEWGFGDDEDPSETVELTVRKS